MSENKNQQIWGINPTLKKDRYDFIKEACVSMNLDFEKECINIPKNEKEKIEPLIGDIISFCERNKLKGDFDFELKEFNVLVPIIEVVGKSTMKTPENIKNTSVDIEEAEVEDLEDDSFDEVGDDAEIDEPEDMDDLFGE